MKVSDMTSERTVTLWCDVCHTESYETDEAQAAQARRLAAQDGWIAHEDPDGDRRWVDVCRACAENEWNAPWVQDPAAIRWWDYHNPLEVA